MEALSIAKACPPGPSQRCDGRCVSDRITAEAEGDTKYRAIVKAHKQHVQNKTPVERPQDYSFSVRQEHIGTVSTKLM